MAKMKFVFRYFLKTKNILSVAEKLGFLRHEQITLAKISHSFSIVADVRLTTLAPQQA